MTQVSLDLIKLSLKWGDDKGIRAHAPVRFHYRVKHKWANIEIGFERVQNVISSKA